MKTTTTILPPLTEGEEKKLGHLLNRVAAHAPGKRYPVPEAAYEPLHRIVPYPAIDMVVLDEGRVLMVWRQDRYFKGWELVGGYGHWGESPQDWCTRLAKRDVGADVQLQGFAGIHVWPPGEHPHGCPISLVGLCRLTSPPTRRDVVAECFSLDNLPSVIVPNHRRFIGVVRDALRTGAIAPVC